MTDFWGCLEFIFRGVLQYILLWAPFIKPLPETGLPPWAWYRYNTVIDWYWHLGADKRPDEHWIRQWLEMAFGEFKALILHESKPYVDAIRIGLLVLIGYVRSGFSSIGAWVDVLHNSFGFPLPWWSGSVKSGLLWLRGKLPAGIREAWTSWDAIFDGIKNVVKNWARARFDDGIAKAWEAVRWVWDWGNRIREWYTSVRDWVNNFRQNPYGTITSTLGSAWSWLLNFRDRGRGTVLGWLGPDIQKILTFGKYCVTFYYNLWARGWRVLGDFIDDPLGFLYEKAERMLIDRW